MKAVLEIELIGDNIVQEMRGWRKFTDGLLPGVGTMTFGGCHPSGWAAEIVDFDEKYKYKREFLRFNKDYSRANSKGSRGVYAEYLLEDGKIYDVKNNKQRYYCKVEDWKIVKITEEEVIQCLNERWESTYSKQRSKE